MAFACKLESHDPAVPPPRWATETMRPPADFVISRDRMGNILSRFGDDLWDLSPYARQLCRLTFLPSVEPAEVSATAEHNRLIFKVVCFYFLYGPRKPISPKEGLNNSARLRDNASP